ncbi:hypothetical protein GCM10007071_27210 [Marinobacter zhanjiangensis]|uniref:Uncharacterized protein n=1 Tax=Marinobacter zhanjiangensis TaxID=578215 RepID=A0ABQ3B818_9GAMM|nr:hypothetical protein GCM10007071_27210 [Marinobacter zhanjiangensis]
MESGGGVNDTEGPEAQGRGQVFQSSDMDVAAANRVVRDDPCLRRRKTCPWPCAAITPSGYEEESIR